MDLQSLPARGRPSRVVRRARSSSRLSSRFAPAGHGASDTVSDPGRAVLRSAEPGGHVRPTATPPEKGGAQGGKAFQHSSVICLGSQKGLLKVLGPGSFSRPKWASIWLFHMLLVVVFASLPPAHQPKKDVIYKDIEEKQYQQ